MMRTLIRQTAFLSASHFFVRTIGFIMRIWLSRELGAQAMGLVELAQSAQMLLITPVISGLPAAISRMCAKAGPERQIRIVRCGAGLALCTSIPLMIIAFCLRTPLALWLGDIRTMPALLVYLPCLPVLGVSCALNGYYYGAGRPVPPALSEILEQIVRFILCLRLVRLLSGWPIILRSAIPAFSTLIGETISLLFMLLLAANALFIGKSTGSRRAILREMLSLSLPLTGMKLVSSLMRTVQSILIPARLQVSGLSRAQALSRLGMINGMMMPVLMLPSFITCSLSMVAAPEMTRRQASGRPQKRLMLRILGAALSVGLPAMATVYLLAPVFAGRLYRQMELTAMLRFSCPLVPMMALSQVTGSMMNGLGLQAASFRISLGANLLSIVLMYALTAQPSIHIWGAIIAMGATQILSLALSLRTLMRHAD